MQQVLSSCQSRAVYNPLISMSFRCKWIPHMLSLPNVLSVSQQCLLKSVFFPLWTDRYVEVIHPVWVRERCRISPPRFLAECRKRRLNQGSCFAVFCIVCFSWVVFSFYSVSVFLICLHLYFPAWTKVNGMALYSLICADVPLRIYSLTHSLDRVMWCDVLCAEGQRTL